MGHYYIGIPKQLVTGILKESAIHSFVETGTSRGDTAIWAASLFKKVYTIEIADEIYRKALSREDAKNKTNIIFIKGNSIDVLPGILNQLEDNTLFWLDGHYSGFETGGKENECPVIDEIKLASKCKNATLLIDDARCFLGPPPLPHNPTHWPGIAQIFACINQYFPGHYTTLVDDIIVSVPQTLKPAIDKDWLQNLDKRYPRQPLIKRALKLGKLAIKKLGRIMGKK